jgi:hypothetical protein
MEGSNTKEDLTGATKMDELVWLYNNTMIDNQMGATGGNKVIAFNNLLKNNSVGGFKNFGPSSIIKNNLFFNNGQPDLVSLRGNVLSEGNVFSTDPKIDEATFMPMSGSPCLNAGLANVTLEGGVKIDVPQEYISGSLPDIGAVEMK